MGKSEALDQNMAWTKKDSSKEEISWRWAKKMTQKNDCINENKNTVHRKEKKQTIKQINILDMFWYVFPCYREKNGKRVTVLPVYQANIGNMFLLVLILK